MLGIALMRTRFDPEITARYGVGELHNAWFTPKGWPGKGPRRLPAHPECELQLCVLQPDGQPLTVINRPQFNRKVKGSVC